jgi:hypothetical protein
MSIISVFFTPWRNSPMYLGMSKSFHTSWYWGYEADVEIGDIYLDFG